MKLFFIISFIFIAHVQFSFSKEKTDIEKIKECDFSNLKYSPAPHILKYLKKTYGCKEDKELNLPADVTKYLEKMASCTHLSSELYSGDEKRDDSLAKTMKENGCATAESESKLLKKKYKDDTKILNKIKPYDIYLENFPVLK